MKSFKIGKQFFKPALLAVQGAAAAAIAYLVANPGAVDSLGVPGKAKPVLAFVLAVLAAQMNSRHSQDTVGTPEIGKRAGDAKLADPM